MSDEPDTAEPTTDPEVTPEELLAQLDAAIAETTELLTDGGSSTE